MSTPWISTPSGQVAALPQVIRGYSRSFFFVASFLKQLKQIKAHQAIFFLWYN